MRGALFNILGSNALSQLLIIASTPLLTRTYPQGDFGWFSVATTLSLVSSTLLTLRLEHSIHVTTLAPAQLYAICLRLAWTSAVMIGIPLVTVLLLLDPMSGSVAAIDLWLILTFATAHATLVVSQIFLNFEQRFRTMAALNLLVPLVFVCGALTFPHLPAQPNGLLFWQACAYAIGALVLMFLQRCHIRLPPLSAMRVALRQERSNWQFLVPSQLLSIVSLNLSVIGAAWLFDPAVAGLVVIAQRIARAPVTVVGNGLNEVLRAAIPARCTLRRTFLVITALCLASGCVMVVGVYLISDALWSRVLGDGWSGLRGILLITVIGAVFQLIGTSVISMLTSFEKRSDLIINACLFVAGACALLTSAHWQVSATSYLWLHTVLSSAVYLIGFWLAWRIARARNDERLPYPASEV